MENNWQMREHVSVDATVVQIFRIIHTTHFMETLIFNKDNLQIGKNSNLIIIINFIIL